MTHSQAQDAVGINPEKMQALIKELKAAHHAIAAFAGEFSAPLSAQGISVRTVHQAEHWTADQVSKLAERLRKFREGEQPPAAGSTPGAPGGSAGAGGTTGAAGPVPAGTGAGAGSVTGAGTGTGTGIGAGAGSGTGAGAGYPSGGGTPVMPNPYGHAPSAVPPAAAAAHPANVQKHATLAAKHVSQAVKNHENLAERIWDDIARNASDPQYAAAFLAALGAAGLAMLGASIARSRKKSKDGKEAERRQAMLDELTRAARQYEGTAESMPGPLSGDPLPGDPLPGDPAEPARQAQDGDQPGAPPRLRLVMAGQAPGDDRPAGEPAGPAAVTDGS